MVCQVGRTPSISARDPQTSARSWRVSRPVIGAVWGAAPGAFVARVPDRRCRFVEPVRIFPGAPEKRSVQTLHYSRTACVPLERTPAGANRTR